MIGRWLMRLLKRRLGVDELDRNLARYEERLSRRDAFSDSAASHLRAHLAEHQSTDRELDGIRDLFCKCTLCRKTMLRTDAMPIRTLPGASMMGFERFACPSCAASVAEGANRKGATHDEVTQPTEA